MSDDTLSASVRAQYEAYPYPARDPGDEARRLVIGSPSHILEIEHYLRAGRPVADGFRALVAGGGTGDAAIMLAQQLAWRGVAAEVTYLDLSAASRALAEARARRRGLANIRFVSGAIEDLAVVAPGPYHYVDCCGVLHHLADPAAGLAALAAQLAPDGGLGLMVYGALGRRGVYDVQAAMLALAGGDADGERLRLVRKLLAGLPKSHWLARNPFVGDHLSGGDAGLYDLLLHRRDRAYTVGQALDLLDGAGFAAAAMIEPARYEPATYIRDPELLERAAALGGPARWALAEQLSGAMTKHIVYAVPRARAGTSAALLDGDWNRLAPVFREMDAAAVAAGMQPGGRLTVDLGGHKASWPLPPLAPAIAALIDGRRPLAAIAGALAVANPGVAEADARAQCARLHAAFHGVNRMLLCHVSGAE